MAVNITDSVCAEILAHFGEQEIGTRCVPCTGNAARRIYDHRGIRLEQSVRREGGEREEYRRRITSRVCNDIRRGDFVASELGESVGSGFATRERGMSRPEIRRKVHDLRACVASARRPFHRRPMRKRAEDQRCLRQRSVLGGDEGERLSRYLDSLPALAVSRRECELQGWMPCDEHAELTPGITAGTENTDRKFMHK
jgi:hypothetical protein